MTEQSERQATVGVWIVLRGANLVPESISDYLKVLPTKSCERGLPKPHFPSMIARIGMWKIESSVASSCAEDKIDELLNVISSECVALDRLLGVEEAILDIFCSRTDDAGNRISASVMIPERNLARIMELGLSICFNS